MIKRAIHCILAIIYLGIIVLSALIVIKPGAAPFHHKITIDPQAIKQDAGFAYRYDLNLSPSLFKTQNLLIYEDGQLLKRAEGKVVIEKGLATYSIGEQTGASAHLYFAASDNTSPITNGRAYTILVPLTFISRPFGILYLLILLPGLSWFILFALASAERRNILRHSPAGILTVLDLFFEQLSTARMPGGISSRQRLHRRLAYWEKIFSTTILAAYFYIFMEWLFFATMPSFMSLLSFQLKAETFLLSGLGLAIFCLAAVAIFIMLDTLAVLLQLTPLTGHLGVILPSILLSAQVLLLIDNFTYTVFKFGISTSLGVWRGAYGVLFLVILTFINYRMLKFFGLKVDDSHGSKRDHRMFVTALCLLAISTGLAFIRMDRGQVQSSGVDAQQDANRPNIILLGSDGLSANYLSVYGYRRTTTPTLTNLANTSLVAENAFTNAGNTAGSVISILTSKLPSQTKMLYPPDILTGLNAYQHLPGILKSLGYRTVEYGMPYYVDAYSFNVQDGFDLVNNRAMSMSRLSTLGQKLGYENAVYFLSKTSSRIFERLLHIFYMREMQNPYKIVTHAASNVSDEKKISDLLQELDASTGPIFIHGHLLGTHGGYYSPKLQVYSTGERQIKPWMEDFYADTILGFDNYVNEVIDHLKENGQFEKTILIIYTDHGQNFKVDDRIPLIVHFPGDQFSGRVTAPVENIDIAPTLLDYMGIPQPAWMAGESMLEKTSGENRLVFSLGTFKVTHNENDVYILDPERNKPPFYQFSFINIINCQKWYQLDLTTFEWTSGEVAGYVEPCSTSDLLSLDEIKHAAVQRLAQDGYDTSSIP